MTIISTDALTNGKLVDLPPEAGDVTQPRFDPVEDWLRGAPALEQKTAMWRWFATRYEEKELAIPRDDEGNYLPTAEEPVKVDKVLKQRFSQTVSQDVVQALISDVMAHAGRHWVEMPMDTLGS